MVKHHPLLKEVILFPRSSMRASLLGRVPKEWQLLSKIRERKFDLVVDLTSGDRPAWTALFSGARYRMAYDPQGKGFWGKKQTYTHVAPHPNDPDLHEVQKNLGLLQHFGIHSAAPKLELHVSQEDESVASQALKSLELQAETPFVIVHPTSRWLFKCWEDSRFAALIDWFQKDLQQPVIVTCGPDERELARARNILGLCASTPKSILGTLSLTQWAAMVRKASLFVGVDSAPMHIAASQNTPSVVLFGPTGFHNWRPWGVAHQLLVHDCPCSRDRNPHCDWSQTRACMLAITLDEVKQAVALALKDQTSKLKK
jgi:heptosyltransferase III